MMKIDGIKPIDIIDRTEKVKQEKNEVKKEKSKEESAAVYEKSKNRNIGHVYDKNAILRLKAESDKAYDSLRQIVEQLLKRQGKTLGILETKPAIEVDEQARLEAQELIGPDGELGVEKVSQRIVDFAIAASGGDKSKLEEIKTAIDKGFKEAEKALGGLPEISLQTYDRIMEKLDAWAEEE